MPGHRAAATRAREHARVPRGRRAPGARPLTSRGLTTPALEKIRDQCLESFAHLEPWPSFFERRYLEFLSYLDCLDGAPPGDVLEIGCGVGYTAALWSQVARSVTASDLPDPSPENHAPGLETARDLHRALRVNNSRVVPAFAEELPFPDASFDLVFSSHVLEHVADTDRALREIRRVLRPGGVHLCVTPTSAERIYAFPLFHLYLAQRSWHHLWRRIFPRRPTASPAAALPAAPAVPIAAAARAQLRSFPFPPPHGTAAHYLAELRGWSPARWRKLVAEEGQLELVQQRSTQISPALILGSALAPRAAARSHALTRGLELRLGQHPAVRAIGFNCVTIARKPGRA